jgi:diguanylate cyclase (GGDEF)-like protein
VQELTEQLKRAQTEALQDPLTGLLNRRGFERAILERGAGAAHLAGAALLVADLDHFKHINDVHGHLLGDKVLQAIARILQMNVKDEGILARLGGEEFAVLLNDTNASRARSLAEKVRSAISMCQIRTGDGKSYVGMVTVSLGVAVAAAGESLEQLIHRADAAMYLAKGAGRNRVFVAKCGVHAAADGDDDQHSMSGVSESRL